MAHQDLSYRVHCSTFYNLCVWYQNAFEDCLFWQTKHLVTRKFYALGGNINNLETPKYIILPSIRFNIEVFYHEDTRVPGRIFI